MPVPDVDLMLEMVERLLAHPSPAVRRARIIYLFARLEQLALERADPDRQATVRAILRDQLAFVLDDPRVH